MSTSETKLDGSAIPTNVSTEGVVLSSNTIDYRSDFGGQGLIIRGTLNITAGTGTTAVTLRVRKGSQVSGAQVGVNLPHTLAAGATAQLYYEVLDKTPATAGFDPAGAQGVGTNQYCVTVQQTGGTGAGTVNYVSIGMESAARTV